MAPADAGQQSLEEEITDLEQRLQHARSRLKCQLSPPDANRNGPCNAAPQSGPGPLTPTLHTLLLLCDSALPLGSFAFSSGLESYLAHHRPSPPSASQVPSVHKFLDLSLSALASTALPYVLTSYRAPEHVEELDNDFDASTPCTVARRASVAQGRALLAVWERSFRTHYASSSATSAKEIEALSNFQSLLRTPASATDLPANAHLAPLWGLLTRILQLSLHESAYLFMFSHARTVASAAVRAGVLGPYQAQAVLANRELQDKIRGLVEEMWEEKVENAGQTVPVMDIWVGRHEMLYSRIFNS
ncbi:hypothetical protein H2201_001740 [Coniosporium apollinis]|uniref:Urease accessory protein n=2 Tax=Coniosporium TaxID=2810619 RepID=A0ABQ9P134_9PEZI|nr:hypothetical protein H2199_007627 [Cladosporium sp. JES 115]KAJ9668310.1 hypothetical protein H2201_001740 [Coniosporium apollinis]